MAKVQKQVVDAGYDDNGNLVVTYDDGAKKILNTPQSEPLKPPPPGKRNTPQSEPLKPPPPGKSSFNGFVEDPQLHSFLKISAYLAVIAASVAVTFASLFSIGNNCRK